MKKSGLQERPSKWLLRSPTLDELLNSGPILRSWWPSLQFTVELTVCAGW